MNDFKNMLRVSLGLIQEQAGNVPLLSWLSEKTLEFFLFQAKKMGADIWTRNSSAFNAHVPLLSDYDLTLFSSSATLASQLNRIKRKYKIMGEINFYHSRIQKDLISLANPYELLRDPTLIRKTTPSLQLTSAARIAFLARQIHSDQQWLRHFPQIRNKKWNYLLHILGEKTPTNLSNKTIVSLILEDDIRADLAEFLNLPQDKELLFSLSKEARWRYLFPNCHIWEDHKDHQYLSKLTTLQKEIMLNQIKWEFWGVGCHYYWLDMEVAIRYLKGMRKLSIDLDAPQIELESMDSVIQFLEDQSSQAK